MKTTCIILLASSFIMLFCSCSKNPELSIEPISQEYNDQFLTGKGLDPRYFSIKDIVQYYQVSGYKSLPPTIVLVKLNTFVNTHYKLSMMDSVKNLNVLFYREKLFAGYSKHLYESAGDNENRTLEGYSDDLVAWITYERLKGDDKKVIRITFFYSHTDDGKPLEQRDTVALK